MIDTYETKLLKELHNKVSQELKKTAVNTGKTKSKIVREQDITQDTPMISSPDLSLSPFDNLTPMTHHELMQLRKTNPKLYSKMINWE